MEFFGVVLGLAVIGYGIYLLVLPFIIKGMSKRLSDVDGKLRAIEAAIDDLRRMHSALKEKRTEGKEEVIPGAAVPPVSDSPAESAPVRTEVEATVGSDKEEAADETGAIAEPSQQPSPWTYTSAQVGKDGWGQGGEPSFAVEKIKSWLLGGNTVARIGVLILFLGVAFLLKYVAEQGWFPIELRLAGAASGGLALVALGWWLRTKRENYALILQGGGIGIVYLTVFATVNLYDLMGTLTGIGLMVVLVVLASLLAVLQNARSLALLAMVGGFLAPVLISSNGSHVGLFSYYAVLNAGVLGIAWLKSWRELNLIGFIFTFVIGGMWGREYYRPEYFLTTEPFLVLFFFFYVAVAVLFATRQAPDLKGYVDGSLVFGVPLAAAGLQYALVRDFEYGLSFSALAAGVFYAVLATVLWRTGRDYMRMLVEAFLALAVVFGTLAIPFAVDGRWTGAAWALEGAALVWIGVHQSRLLARLFGLIVQLAAGIALLGDLGGPAEAVPVLNSEYLCALMVSGAGLYSAFCLYRYRHKLRESEMPAGIAMLAWGLAWWFGAGIHELVQHLDGRHHHSAILVFVAISLTVTILLRRRLDWHHLKWPPLVLLPLMLLVALVSFADRLVQHPLTGLGAAAWPVSLLVQLWIMRRLEREWPQDFAARWHTAGLLLLVFMVTWEAAWLVEQGVDGFTWRHVVWGLVPAAFVMGLPRVASRYDWPMRQFEEAYLGTGLLILVLAIGAWALHASFQAGDPQPLPYVPIINPLELSQCLALMVTLWWSRGGWIQGADKLRWQIWPTVAFVALNGMIARAIHHLGGVPFEMPALWGDPIYQAALSITWTVTALGIMVAGTRLAHRSVWLVGSALLGAVVVKLLLVDLAGIGTVARFVSFIVVGLLILLIGYLSPLPPRVEERTES